MTNDASLHSSAARVGRSENLYLMLDCTSASAGGHRPQNGGRRQSPGRSQGGLSTKIHLLANGLGEPVAFRLTAGQAGEFAQALPLLAGRHVKPCWQTEAMTQTPSWPPSKRSEQNRHPIRSEPQGSTDLTTAPCTKVDEHTQTGAYGSITDALVHAVGAGRPTRRTPRGPGELSPAAQESPPAFLDHADDRVHRAESRNVCRLTFHRSASMNPTPAGWRSGLPAPRGTATPAVEEDMLLTASDVSELAKYEVHL
jgi:hypothetical protein